MKALVYDVRPAGYLACLLLKQAWPGCLLTGLNGLSLRELQRPALPGEDWVRCRTILGGICGTDLGLIQQRQPPDSILQCFSTLPTVLGHENVAAVEEVGPAVDTTWLGKRVCVEPTLSCRVRGIDPPCLPCQLGQHGACENFSAAGLGRYRLPPGTSVGYCGAIGGAWGESFLTHQSQLVPVPDGLTDRQAVLTDPLACSLHAIFRTTIPSELDGSTGVSPVERGGSGEPSRGAGGTGNVLVYGSGILGLGIVWGLRAIGYAGNIDVSSRHGHQADWAGRLGASQTLALPADAGGRFAAVAARTGGRVSRARFNNYMLSGGYDVVFDCVGSPKAIEECLKWTRARGQVVLVATGHGRGADLTPVWFRELNVAGAYGRSVETFRGRQVHTYLLAHELMLQSKVDLSGLLTHTFRLADYKQALWTALDKGPSKAIKVAFEF